MLVILMKMGCVPQSVPDLFKLLNLEVSQLSEIQGSQSCKNTKAFGSGTNRLVITSRIILYLPAL